MRCVCLFRPLALAGDCCGRGIGQVQESLTELPLALVDRVVHALDPLSLKPMSHIIGSNLCREEKKRMNSHPV